MAYYDIIYGPGIEHGLITTPSTYKSILLAGSASQGITYANPDSYTSLTIAPTGSVYVNGGSAPAVLAGRAGMINYGSIFSGNADGIRLNEGGAINNYGMIVAQSRAIFQDAVPTIYAMTVFNAGLIVRGGIESSNLQQMTVVNAGTGGIYAGVGNNAIRKTAGTLTLENKGTIVGNVFSADGNDFIVNNGSIESDRFNLGGGDDTLTNNGLIISFIYLDAGNDIYRGLGRIQGTVSGGDGNDWLTGGIYDDRLRGDNGDDVLDGGLGNDTMTGGLGNDTYYVDSARDLVIEAVGGGNDKVYASVSYVLRAGQEIETLAVNPGADFADLAIKLTGNEFANSLIGNAANNKLDGLGGADTMTGGDGNDIYYVDNAGDVVVETANQGTDTVYTAVSHTLAAHVEILRALGTEDIALTGNGLANTIVGNAGNNRLDGGEGADTMTGGAGNDTYVVDNVLDMAVEKLDGGTDTVEAGVSFALRGHIENLILTGTAAIDGTGNAAANTIVGNDAANTISGKGGFDTLTGGGGGDTFVFAHKLNAALNVATITDFEHGVDRIALDDAFFKKIGSSGTLDEAFFSASAPTNGDQHILYDRATGVLSYDFDGVRTKPAIAFAQVTPGTVLDHNDFLIV